MPPTAARRPQRGTEHAYLAHQRGTQGGQLAVGPLIRPNQARDANTGLPPPLARSIVFWYVEGGHPWISTVPRLLSPVQILRYLSVFPICRSDSDIWACWPKSTGCASRKPRPDCCHWTCDRLIVCSPGRVCARSHALAPRSNAGAGGELPKSEHDHGRIRFSVRTGGYSSLQTAFPTIVNEGSTTQILSPLSLDYLRLEHPERVQYHGARGTAAKGAGAGFFWG